MRARVAPATSQREASAIGTASVLGFELALVVADEVPDLIGHVEQLDPLLLVERHGEPAHPVHRDGPLLAHLQAASAALTSLQPLVLRPQPLQLLTLVLFHRTFPIAR